MSGWFALALVMVAASVSIDAPGLLLVATVTAAYGSLTRLWTRYGIRRVEYGRRLSTDRAVAGDDVAMDVTMWNRKALPLPWVAADDLLTEGLTVRERGSMDRDNEMQGRRILHNAWALAWFERVVRHFHLDAVSRGVYEFGPVRVRVRDILGRDAVADELELPATLVVAPRSVAVRRRGTETSRIGERRAQQSLFTDPALYGGVRPFQAGDSMRRVHWRASARLGQPVSRRFEPARGREVILAIDVQTIEGPYWDMNWDEAAFEGLCVAAASLARDLLDSGASVGVAAASFTGTPQRMAWLAPQATAGQTSRVGALLARIGPVSSGPFSGLLTWLTRRVAPGATVMVLTARDPGPHLAALRRLARSGYAVELVTFGTDGDAYAAAARQAALSARSASLTPGLEHPDALVLVG